MNRRESPPLSRSAELEAAIEIARADVEEAQDGLAQAVQKYRDLRQAYPEFVREELIAMLANVLEERMDFEQAIFQLVIAIEMLAGKSK